MSTIKRNAHREQGPRPQKHKGLLNMIFLALALSMAIGLQACGPSASEQFQQFKDAGDTFFDNHEYQQAIKQWEQALATPNAPPPGPDFFAQLAEAYSRRAAPFKVQAVLEKGLLHNPSSNRLLLATARLHLNLAEINKADLYWENSIKNMQNAAGYIFAGDLYSIKGDLKQAEKFYLTALGSEQKNKSALARLAICQLGLQQDEKATATYERLLALSPSAPLTLYQIGNYWRIKNEHPKADMFFHKSCSSDPGNLTLKKNLAEYYFTRERFDDALATITDALHKTPANSSFQKLHIEILLRLKNLGQARLELEKLAAKGNLDVEMLLLKGKYFLLEQKVNFAIAHFSEAIKKEPTLPISHYLLAVAYFANDKINLAQKSAIKALSLNMYFSDAELLLANLFYKKQEYETAGEHLQRIIKREPENPRPYMLFGAIDLSKRHFKAALNNFKKARALSPTRLSPSFFSAVAQEKTGDRAQAMETYRQLITRAPQFTSIAQRYISNRHGQENLNEMSKFLLTIPDNSGHTSEYHEIIGLALISEGNEIRGLKHLRKALQINPKLYSSYLHLADYYEKKKQWPEFLEVLNDCLALQPDNISAIVKLTDYYVKNESNAKALAIINKGIRQAPESPILANCKAWILMETQTDMNQAFILARKAYDKLPDNPAVADTLGLAYYHKKMYTRAQWLLEDAQLKAPKEPMIAYHLALVFQAANKKDKTKQFLNQSLQLGLSKPHKTIAEALLNEL